MKIHHHLADVDAKARPDSLGLAPLGMQPAVSPHAGLKRPPLHQYKTWMQLFNI